MTSVNDAIAQMKADDNVTVDATDNVTVDATDHVVNSDLKVLQPVESLNFDMVKTDTITFTQEILPEHWVKLQEFVRSQPETKHFKLIDTFVNIDTKIQEITFCATKPELFLNLLIIWWVKTFEVDDNVTMLLYVRSSVICSTQAARAKIKSMSELIEKIQKLVKEDKAAGLDCEGSLRKMLVDYEIHEDQMLALIDKIKSTTVINEKIDEPIKTESTEQSESTNSNEGSSSSSV